MAGVDVAAPKTREPKGHKKIGKKRVGIRIDMTPMVDVVMLLITFFMLTTVFNTPQTMEINLPPDPKARVEVAETSLMTLRVMSDGSVYWNMGIETPNPVAFKELRPLIAEHLNLNSKLIILLKVDREGTFEQMVDIMDELNLANVTRFSLAPLTAMDKEYLQKSISSLTVEE